MGLTLNSSIERSDNHLPRIEVAASFNHRITAAVRVKSRSKIAVGILTEAGDPFANRLVIVGDWFQLVFLALVTTKA